MAALIHLNCWEECHLSLREDIYIKKIGGRTTKKKRKNYQNLIKHKKNGLKNCMVIKMSQMSLKLGGWAIKVKKYFHIIFVLMA